MFESVTNAELIDVMGEESREESAAVARRLAAVGELFARRAQELVEGKFWFTDPREATAAEVSAALNISRARASRQIHYAWTLRERLPAVGEGLRHRSDRFSASADDHCAYGERR